MLTTPRLVLRGFTAADADAVTALAGEREVARNTLTLPHPYPDGAAATWIATHQPAWEAGWQTTLAITAQRRLVGAISITRVGVHGCGELGYWIGLEFWNRGYATEAVGEMIRFGFDALGLHRIQAHHFVRNPASGRVMVKAGMTFEGVARQAVMRWGVREDLAGYVILTDSPTGPGPPAA